MIRRFWILAIHMFLVAGVCSLPHWAAMYSNDGDYSPFAVSPSVSALTFDETHAYAPPARRFMTEGKIATEVDNFEHRSMTAGIPFIPAITLGLMGRLLGSLERAFLFADCLFPALLLLLYFRLAGALVSTFALRLLVSWSSILIPFGLLNSVWLGDDALIAPLELTRTPQPEISYLVLIAAAALLARALRDRSDWRRTAAAGIASGAVVYCYYFYAVAWGITLGLVLLFGLAWRQRPVWERSSVVLVSMIVLSLPYISAAAKGNAQGGQTYLLARMGEYTHRTNFLALICAVLCTAIFLAIGKSLWRKQPASFVLLVLAAASIYGMNFQIVSGYETQPWHFWKRLALPVLFFLITASLAGWIERRVVPNRAWIPKAAVTCLVLLIAETAARLIYAGVRVAPFERASNPDIAMLTWIRGNLAPEQVLGTLDPELILLIPALTSDYTYVPSGLRSLTATEEIVGRYFELACLEGLSPREVERIAAVPNHLGHSTELLQVLGLSYTGDRAVYEWFVNRYLAASRQCTSPKWRLDYLVIRVEPTAERAAKAHFPSAAIVYKNSRWALLRLPAA